MAKKTAVCDILLSQHSSQVSVDLVLPQLLWPWFSMREEEQGNILTGIAMHPDSKGEAVCARLATIISWRFLSRASLQHSSESIYGKTFREIIRM